MSTAKLVRVVACAALAVLLAAFAWTVWPTPWRHFKAEGVNVRVQRATGTTEVLDPSDGWVNVKEEDARRDEERTRAEAKEQAKMTEAAREFGRAADALALKMEKHLGRAMRDSERHLLRSRYGAQWEQRAERGEVDLETEADVLRAWAKWSKTR